MAINLGKNQSINLSKSAIDLSKGQSNGLKEVIVGLGWDVAQPKKATTEKKGFFSSLFGGPATVTTQPVANIDCDASVVLCRNGHYVNDRDLIYFGHQDHSSGAVHHCGDNLTGEGEGDDEQIVIRFDKLPDDVDKIGVVVNIYSAISRRQHFGMIENAFVRIVDSSTGIELCNYNLSENYNGKIAMIFGELYKENGEWQFKAIGTGTDDTDVGSLARRFR